MQSLNHIIETLGSKNASFNGKTIDMSRQFGYSCEVVVTAQSSLASTLKLQASNDGTNWADISTPSAVTMNANGNFIISITDYFFYYIRPVVTITAGSATFVVNHNSKGA